MQQMLCLQVGSLRLYIDFQWVFRQSIDIFSNSKGIYENNVL